MKKHVAFLRAINVGGTKIIKMENLKRIFESFGYANVQTYIQSGNVIFETKETVNFESKLEAQLEKSLGYKVETFVRTFDEVAKIVSKAPFEIQEGETLHVVFLRQGQGVDKKSEQSLLSFRSGADDFAIQGSEVYNLRRDRDQSVFSNQFIEKTLKAETTTRNITTLKKIVDKFKEE